MWKYLYHSPFLTFGTKTRHKTVVLAKRIAQLKMMKRRSTWYMNTLIVGTATAIVTATVYTEKAMYLPRMDNNKLMPIIRKMTGVTIIHDSVNKTR